jgi:hypothetical protein
MYEVRGLVGAGVYVWGARLGWSVRVCMRRAA